MVQRSLRILPVFVAILLAACTDSPSGKCPDADADGVCDRADGCPADPAKGAPGSCGCGIAEVDTDGDGTADCVDACPADAAKAAPGTCGCGVADADTDGDGRLDCVDNCPAVANPGQENGDGPGVVAIPYAPEPPGGTRVRLYDDEVSEPIPFPFPFAFFGEPVAEFRLYDNGLLELGTTSGSDGCCEGGPLAEPEDGLQGFVAIAWTDLLVEEGTLTWEVRGEEGARRLVVTYRDVPILDDDEATLTAQAILFEGSNRIELHTGPRETRWMPITRGIESPDGTAAVALPSDVVFIGSRAADAVAFEMTDAFGDACDTCPAWASANLDDGDGDGVGDACDGCPLDVAKAAPGGCGCGMPEIDGDGDGVSDCVDNCLGLANPDQRNSDEPTARTIPFAPEPVGGATVGLREGGEPFAGTPIPVDFPLLPGAHGAGAFVADVGALMLCVDATDCGFETMSGAVVAAPVPLVLFDSDRTGNFEATWEVRGSPGDRRLVVSWVDLPVPASWVELETGEEIETPGGPLTTQVIVREGGEVEIHTTAAPLSEYLRGMMAAEVELGLPGEFFGVYELERSAASYALSDAPGDACDICPRVADPAQADSDGDGEGDACERVP